MGANRHGERVDSAALRDDKDRLLAHLTGVLASSGIRILTGGGRVFAVHGLVSPSVASWVSVFISPADVAEFVRVLRSLGWRHSPQPDSRGGMPSPPVHLAHDDWLVPLRVYSTIPGFFADPIGVFDEFWRRRGAMTLQEQQVPIVDRITTAAFASHNRLSGTRTASGPNFAFLLAEIVRSFTVEERFELLALSRQIGGTEELRSVLVGLGLDPGPPTVPTPEYTSWRLALDEPTDADRWLVARFELPGVAARAVRPQLTNLTLREQRRAAARMLGAPGRVAARDAL